MASSVIKPTETIAAGVGQLINVHEVLLSDNPLERLPAEIGQIANLQYLRLHDNRLSDLPAELGQLTRLKQLIGPDNQLGSIPAEIGQLASLEALNLGDNHLISLPAELGQLAHLQALFLRGNQLISLPAELGQLTNLERLDLNWNQLRSLPPELGQLTNLEWLYVSRNQLSSLPAELGQLTKLEWLDVSGNQLNSLPPELGQLVKLELLHVEDNRLSSLPSELGQLRNIKVLNVDGNSLEEVLPPEVVWHGQEAILAFLRVGRLETERLMLKHLDLKDAPVLFEILSHDEVRRFDNIPSLSSPSDAETLIEQARSLFAHHQGMRLGITLKYTGELIGICGYLWDRENALAVVSGELAYAYWGQGIMIEALQVLIRFGFEENQLNRMECLVVVENAASVRLFQKLGFQAEGVLRKRLFINKQFRDMLSLALLRQDVVQADNA